MIRLRRLLDFWLVDESIQPGGSFKSRGVRAQMREYWQHGTSAGLVTFTSGNHGIAVALAARQRHVLPTVVVPHWIEPNKLRLLTALGCRVVRGGSSATECENAALQIANRTGAFLAHPYRSAAQVAGYTTLWDEISKAFPGGVDVVVPVGSGGLLSAGVLYRTVTNARYNVIGGEPKLCASLARSLNMRVPHAVQTRSEEAPALNVDQPPLEVLDLVQSSDIHLFALSEHEIALTTRALSGRGLSVDPAASVAIGCALFCDLPRQFRDMVVVLTGKSAGLNVEQLGASRFLGGEAASVERLLGRTVNGLTVDVSTRRNNCHPSISSFRKHYRRLREQREAFAH